MGFGSEMTNIVLLALVAIFIGLRLRSVLGSRTGNEKPPKWIDQPGPPDQSNQPSSNVVDLSNRRGVWEAGSPASQEPQSGMAAIQRLEPGLTPDLFLAGAKSAFGMIIAAFGGGDRATLKTLLSDAVYAQFDQALTARDQARALNHPWGYSRLIAITGAEIVAAEVQGPVAEVTVRFESRQTATEVSGGQMQEAEITVSDLWTFQRRLGTPDPTWVLIATRPVEEPPQQ